MTLSIFSHSQQSFSFTQGDRIHYVEAYQFNDKWVIDHYRVLPGKLQERIEQSIYHDKKFWERRLNLLHRKAQDNASNLFPTDTTVDTENFQSHIWITKDVWSLDWEIKYQEWIRAEVNHTFFAKYKIATDCADIMFALRWIFSRINYLAIGNTLAGSRKLFTNESFKNSWINLPRAEEWFNDEVFLAALNYLFDNTYTGTLFEDSMPVKISPTTFAEGSFFLTMRGPQEMGHTEVIYNIVPNPGRINIMFSDIPKKVRKLFRSAAFPKSVNPYTYSMRNMKWINKDTNNKWAFISDVLHPHYSLFQFSPEFSDGFSRYYNALFYHLGLTYDYEKHYQSLKARLMDQLIDRVTVVKEGYEFCAISVCNPGTPNYQLWSTPSRDAKVVETFNMIDNVLKSASSPDLDQDYKNWLLDSKLEVLDSKILELNTIRNLFINNSISSDPRQSVLIRWGL